MWAPHAPPGRMAPGPWTGGVLSTTPTKKPLVQPRRIRTWWRIPHEPNIFGSPGKHSRHLWVWLGQRYHTRRGQRSRIIIPGGREHAFRCSDRHLVVREHRRKWVVNPVLHRSMPVSTATPRLGWSAWGVRNSSWGSPHHYPQIVSDYNGLGSAPGCRDERRITAWAEGVFCATPRWSCPKKRTSTIQGSFLSMLNTQTREAALVTVLSHPNFVGLSPTWRREWPTDRELLIHWVCVYIYTVYVIGQTSLVEYILTLTSNNEDGHPECPFKSQSALQREATEGIDATAVAKSSALEMFDSSLLCLGDVDSACTNKPCQNKA